MTSSGVPSAVRIMTGFDVFTLSSRFEGLPVALMEARALGLPVVVTAVGGLVDHVTDGVDGRLVSPQNPDALAAALRDVVGDAGVRESLSNGSAHRAADFDARVAVRRQEQIYRPV